jgi:hypothetical protein
VMDASGRELKPSPGLSGDGGGEGDRTRIFSRR